MVFSDFLCPWCYVGAIRLGDIAREEGDAVDWQWRSYLLRPEPQPRPRRGVRPVHAGVGAAGSMEPRARFTTWAGRQPATVAQLPRRAGRQGGRTASGPDAAGAYRAALFPAYFTENRTISDRSVLVDLAAEAGLERDSFEQAWRDHEDELLKEVWVDHATAVQSGIQGVPAVVVNRRWLVSGAVEADEYRAVIAQAREAAEDLTGRPAQRRPRAASAAGDRRVPKAEQAADLGRDPGTVEPEVGEDVVRLAVRHEARGHTEHPHERYGPLAAAGTSPPRRRATASTT